MQIRQFQAQRMQAPRDFTPIENTPICVEIGAGKGKHALLLAGNSRSTHCMQLNEPEKNSWQCKNSMVWNQEII